MSRIHEALQRAYLERGKLSVPDDIHVAEPRIAPIMQEQPVVKAEVALENITEYSWKPSIQSFPTLADRGAGVEQFRSLRSHIYQARYDAPLKTILIASGMPSEGKSFVAANLAVSLARNSIHNILLIDGDLRRPTLHTLLGAPNSPGLSNYLEGTAEMNDIMQRDRIAGAAENASVGSISNLTFIPSGGSSDHSSELVANHRMEELITAASPYFDWILIDAPPVLAVSDAVELSRASDAVLLVARGSTTPYDVAQRAKAAFGTSRILGFVLNAVKDAPRKGSYNYNYYYSGEPEGGDQGKRRKESGR
jgi:capsular exopolysaccharide synthesis family protein